MTTMRRVLGDGKADGVKIAHDSSGLERLRQEIDAADQEILKALERRARCVQKIARYKREHGIPVLDAAREEVILRRVEERKGLLPGTVRADIFATIIRRMREWQSTLDE